MYGELSGLSGAWAGSREARRVSSVGGQVERLTSWGYAVPAAVTFYELAHLVDRGRPCSGSDLQRDHRLPHVVGEPNLVEERPER